MERGSLNTVWVRLYEELNDYLPEQRRKKDLAVVLKAPSTVRSLIDSLNIPATEVDLVLVNGKSAAWQTMLVPGDRLSVYPVFELLDIERVTRLRRRPLRRLRFLVDADLSELSQELRRAGFDTVYHPRDSVSETCRRSIQEKRILLTRRRTTFVEAGITRVIALSSAHAATQLQEVLQVLGVHLSGK